MTTSNHFEKWASGALGVVCLVLLLNLVFRESVRAGAPRPPARPVISALPRPVAAPALAALPEAGAVQPQLQVELLDEIQQRPLPEISRNPFEFGNSGRSTAAAGMGPNSAAPGAVVAAGPPPPPAINIKALGFVERIAGEREAMLSDDEDIYIVREGQPFGTRYRVAKITGTTVDVEDVQQQRTVQLAMPE